MTYPPTDDFHAGPPERSPWSSPLVIVAIAAGSLLVVAGVLAAVLLLPGTGTPSTNTLSASSTKVVTTTVSAGQTAAGSSGENGAGGHGAAGGNSGAGAAQQPGAPTHTTTVTVPPGTTTAPGRPVLSVTGADWQGFTAGPRCNAADDPAVAIGRTARSQVVICRVGDQGGLYYKGYADGNSIELQNPVLQNSVFRVTNGPYMYTVSPIDFYIYQNGDVVSGEPMLEYWTP